MKPSLSLIAFSVLSGAGFGLFVLLVLAQTLALEPVMDRRALLIAGAAALALVAVGLTSSAFHLANPKNGIKAFNRVLTSWLSREAVLALLFFPLALGWLAAVALTGAEDHALGLGLSLGLGVLASAVALATVFSTSMIYASLKTIRQWHNPLVPAAYLAIGLASGGVLLMALRALLEGRSGDLAGLTLGLIAVAATIKLIYWFWIGQPEGPTINTAVAQSGRRVRLLDVGHSHGTFLTDEFGNRIGPRASRVLRGLALVLGFILPFVILAAGGAVGLSPAPALAAAVVLLLGVGVERWLFLIEGQHVVNLYHGRAQT
jgi:DMSO reductase anchor subunit